MLLLRGLTTQRLLTRGFYSATPGSGSVILLRGLTSRRLLTRGYGEASSTDATMFIVATVSSYSGFVEPGFTQVSNL